MIRPFDIPNGWRCWTKEYVPDNRHPDAGWYAVNSVAARDCIPSYRLPGGGVSDSQLTDLPEAIDSSIGNLQQRIREAEVMIDKLEKFKEYLGGT